MLIRSLLSLYLPLIAAVSVGGVLSYFLRGGARQQVPAYLGRFLFYVGVPLSIVSFVYRTELSGAVLVAPLVAWAAMLFALMLAWGIVKRQAWPSATRGSFLLTAMLGNTGYLGFPVVLLLPKLGPRYLGWALFYDMLGTLFGAYFLGVVLAASFSRRRDHRSGGWLFRQVVLNPSLWAFGVGLLLKGWVLPPWVVDGLVAIAWTMITLSLVLMGIRLQQLSAWHHLTRVAVPVGIKILLLPLLVGLGLSACGWVGPPRLVLTLQAGMPCAFATLVLTETYGLDYELTVSAVGLSSALLLVTLPIWIWGFG
ncbi:MAG: AEC family transporter [Cyanobacteria bacterium P01_G01_bin.38]